MMVKNQNVKPKKMSTKSSDILVEKAKLIPM